MNVNDQKKYNECIDFPVEIVGKDGVVRHYSFEESISYINVELGWHD